ncbi:unnamed protein product [Acanthosepion pharaonis]|uniref:Transmembrane protein n=1 Tax=Acanthosepion pharaonis TaxID=158019 RepID=A0A812DJM3_ACAPH|nr:unnamed protein product [Sepia pharaonis]
MNGFLIPTNITHSPSLSSLYVTSSPPSSSSSPSSSFFSSASSSSSFRLALFFFHFRLSFLPLFVPLFHFSSPRLNNSSFPLQCLLLSPRLNNLLFSCLLLFFCSIALCSHSSLANSLPSLALPPPVTLTHLSAIFSLSCRDSSLLTSHSRTFLISFLSCLSVSFPLSLSVSHLYLSRLFLHILCIFSFIS